MTLLSIITEIQYIATS